MNAVATPSRFDELEAAIARLPQVHFETIHHFAPGIYARELRLPAGAILTGRVHKGKAMNIVCGDISVGNDLDGEMTRIIGHSCFVSEPGTRRAGVANLPTIWVCIHENPTNETDLKKLEEMFVSPHVNPLIENNRREIV